MGVKAIGLAALDRRTASQAYRKASMTWFFLSSSTGNILPVNGSCL
jgi:hypothetical protein